MMLPDKLEDWPEKYLELWAERAAIMEYQGNVPRDEAEQLAEADTRERAKAELFA